MNTTSSSATTPARDFCSSNPCGRNLVECVALYSTYTCLCPYGYYYSDKDCHSAKIFPGVITLSESYSNSVQTVNSVEYEEVFQNVTKFFDYAFRSFTDYYKQTVIVEIQLQSESRASHPISIIVINLFTNDSPISNDTVISAIDNATNESTYVSQYEATTYCAVFKCDAETTVCEEDVFPKCICKSNYSMTEWDVHSCSDCNNCSAEENKYCAKENGIPTCKCKPNFEPKNGACVSCAVGYSGENCTNNSELILIIVGTVFGAIILSLVIAVSVVSVRAKRRQDPGKKSLIKSGYSNPNTSDDTQPSMFPRVQTTSGHVNPGYQPHNPYEMHPANRGRFPERDYDDLYATSREPEGFRMQSTY
nr:PREDICTED: mucin-13 [Opisthocomus hoazin]